MASLMRWMAGLYDLLGSNQRAPVASLRPVRSTQSHRVSLLFCHLLVVSLCLLSSMGVQIHPLHQLVHQLALLFRR